MRRAPRVQLTETESRQLSAWARDGRGSTRRARRAAMVLLASEGRTNQEIARRLHVHPETVALWRRRFVSNRLEGVSMDAPRSGRSRRLARLTAQILEAAKRTALEGGKPWTMRGLARRFGVSHMTVYRARQTHSLGRSFRPADRTGPGATIDAEPMEMEGIFLHPPRRAAVFQVDGRGQEAPGLGSSPRAPPAPAGASSKELGGGLSGLFDQWRRWSMYRGHSPRSVAELLVFLRMVERRAPTVGSFLVLYEGFSRTAEKRIERWTHAHPRFRPMRVPSGRSWFRTVEHYLDDRSSPPPLLPPQREAVRPLTESLASYLQMDPAAPAPFVWSTLPSIEGPSGGA